MSADNGIYIGKFPKDIGHEYRVIHAQAIENLEFFDKEEDAKKYAGENPRAIVEYFGGAPVYSETRAFHEAQRMEKEILSDDFCPILEYGISTITFKHPFAYYQEHAHEIVYSWDKAEVVE